MSSNNSFNSPTGNPGMGNNSYVFQQIFISIIVLSSIFIVVCVVRWILLRVSTRRDASSSLPEKRNAGGLDSAAIAALPTFPYRKYGDNKEGDEENNVSSSMDCSICLSAVEEGETVKLLPICMHSFHGDCVGLWLSAHSTCPVCRAEVLASTSAVQWEQNRVDLVVVVPVLDDIERQP